MKPLKLLVKRVYCPVCHKLVRGREQKVETGEHVSCSRCGRLLWLWNGVTWRFNK